MDFRRLIAHFTYRIEPKPEGGFTARSESPSVPAIEAATREELQEKIRANIAAALAAEFPDKASGAKEMKVSFHIERGPDGSLAIHTSDPNARPIAGGQGEIESHFAEKVLGFVGKH